ncbi:MAG: alpha/beta fold hydrolase [Burkholderiales bacterium]|nr:alpha/beta fold hydrolase [Burkholderiales bacterium]
MPSRSALARLQQGTTLSTVFAALAWLVWRWQDSPAGAVAGAVFIAFFYSFVLAIEFAAMRFVGGGDPAPRPTWGELGHAWLCETIAALRVFAWRQPFRWREVPDHLAAPGEPARRGVVFIHGFVCNRGFWTPWMKELRERGHSFVAVNLEPVFGSIDDYVPIVEKAVDAVTRATGMPPVLVCHSMGGLAARAWLCAAKGESRVDHVITIGSPHQGTWLAQFSHLTNGKQMKRQGEWLRCLEQQEAAGATAKFTCWYTNCDNIVFPASTATLPGADNRLVRGVAHVELAFHPRVMRESLDLVARDTPR